MPNEFFDKSNKTWNEGQKCLSNGHINSAANRIYYSVFQAVYGFGLHCGEMSGDSTEQHRKVLVMVRDHGKSGAGRHFSDRLRLLYGLRIKADYKSEDVEPEKLNELLEDADKIRGRFLALVN